MKGQTMTHLVDRRPYLGHGQNGGLNLLWAEVADTNALDKALLDTFLQGCPCLLKGRYYLGSWLH